MKKGISPVVAVVLLIAIAVIAAVGVWYWVGSTKPYIPPSTFGQISADACNGSHLRVRNGGNAITSSDADVYLRDGAKVANLTLTGANELGISELAWRPLVFESGYLNLTKGTSYEITGTDYTKTTFTC